MLTLNIVAEFVPFWDGLVARMYPNGPVFVALFEGFPQRICMQTCSICYESLTPEERDFIETVEPDTESLVKLVNRVFHRVMSNSLQYAENTSFLKQVGSLVEDSLTKSPFEILKCDEGDFTVVVETTERLLRDSEVPIEPPVVDSDTLLSNDCDVPSLLKLPGLTDDSD